MPKSMVKLNVHPYSLGVWFTDDLHSFNLKRRKIHPSGHDIADMSGCVYGGEYSGCMVVGVFDSKLRTLVHELAHVLVRISEHIGMDIGPYTTEPFAYLFESLYEQCAGHLDEWGNKNA